MIIELNPHSQLPLYRQLIDQIIYRIAAGSIASNERLPSIRDLSSSLRINPNTVIKAYRELEYLGYAYSEQGTGYFITDGGISQAKKEWQEKITRELKNSVIQALSLGITKEKIIELINSAEKGGEK